MNELFEHATIQKAGAFKGSLAYMADYHIAAAQLCKQMAAANHEPATVGGLSFNDHIAKAKEVIDSTYQTDNEGNNVGYGLGRIRLNKLLGAP